ncbi:MAG TPA: putative quinol monooxygenase [Acidobacteriaceae bacterium]|jgi:quinol monooxygenase YgiN
MLSFTVRMRFNPDDRQEIEALLLQLTPASRQEPGCVSYVPHWVEGEAACLLIYEQYADEAALEAHRASPHFAIFAVNGLYQRMLDRELEHLTAIA